MCCSSVFRSSLAAGDPVKVYVAGSRHEVDTIRMIYQVLIDTGHEIVYDWTREENVSNGKPRENWLEHQQEGRLIAFAERDAVSDADALIVCGWGAEKALGTYIEIGMALARQKPVIWVGPYRNSIFWCLPEVIIVEDVKDGIRVLEALATA